jgi:hypothetical protein
MIIAILKLVVKFGLMFSLFSSASLEEIPSGYSNSDCFSIKVTMTLFSIKRTDNDENYFNSTS